MTDSEKSTVKESWKESCKMESEKAPETENLKTVNGTTTMF